MAMTRKAAARQQWFRAFEDAVLKLAPHLAGKLDWDTATFFFNEGMTADDAAARFVVGKRLGF